jgi:glutamate N-acetyltransferase/amino-acid N-acetyltransferase
MTASNLTEQKQNAINKVRGFRVAGVHCGLKKNDRLDLALIVSDSPCVTAGVFTTNEVKAAPVLLGMDRLRTHAGDIRAVVINTGSANAVTGNLGYVNATLTTELVGKHLKIPAKSVIPMSTGVIGAHLPMEKIEQGISDASQQLGDNWTTTATAIMTTDTRPKYAERQIQTTQGNYAIAGIAKGAGMIAPNMATMLSVIVTDVSLTPAQADRLLKQATSQSFNHIVVDGDMSTNDTVLLLANGESGVILSDDDLTQFQEELTSISRELAHAIVRDGEGVTKFITVHVKGTNDDLNAYKIAYTIATSALVKTAFYGNDANWGRILAAAGRSGVRLEQDKVNLRIAKGVEITLNGVDLLHNGAPTAYAESDAYAIMQSAEITVTLDLQSGTGQAIVWTTDFSHEYVSINADYRT